MPHRKQRNGNGAEAQVDTSQSRGLAPTRRSGWPARLMEGHPLGRLRDEIDSLFDSFFGSAPMRMDWDVFPERMADLDVHESDKEISVRADAPGFEPQDFQIHVSGNTLTIEAEHKAETEDTRDNVHSW